MPDGSWGYGGWVSRGTIDNRDGHYTTEQVPSCAPGIYRWRGRFIWATHPNTTWTGVGNEVVIK